MSHIGDQSVQLIVSSPPYPMIEMWDELFATQNSEIKTLLEKGAGPEAFELMHKQLDAVWDECYRILIDGGFICINIGDATRSLNKEFQLYSNHSRILKHFTELGLNILPEILWRKQTNAPNKFMGSGMLPAGAYVTLEHEYILIARKNGKREFKTDAERALRQESAFFWEERNIWFSDIWEDIKGIQQKIISDTKLRERSAAFPFELAYRLINMYSVKGDIVVDPFLGTGTTIVSAIASERNSIGLEVNKEFEQLIKERLVSEEELINNFIKKRLENHTYFIAKRLQSGKEIKYVNKNHNFPVVTKQEENLIIRKLQTINHYPETKFKASYEEVG